MEQVNQQTENLLENQVTSVPKETFFDKYIAGEKTKGAFNPTAKDVVDTATDFIPGVSETKDIISLGTNVNKGEYAAAGIDLASLILGAVPIVGDVARRGLKTFTKNVVKSEDVASKQADEVGESLQKVFGNIEPPKKTVKAYKLFKADKKGNLYPLFVKMKGNKPLELNKWTKAEAGEINPKTGKVKSSLGDLAYRPGFHGGDLPVATHIGGKKGNVTKPNYRKDNQVWAEVEFGDDKDWQSIANSRAIKNKDGKIQVNTAHITDQVPKGGHYRYKTNPNMTGNWIIGGELKINKILSDKEVKSINDKAGVADLPRLKDLKLFSGGDVMDKDIEMGVLPKARPEYLKRAYDMVDTDVMGYNASLLELKTNPERALQNEKNMFYPPSRFEGDEEVLKLVDKIRGENIAFSREDMEKNPRVGFKEGGMPKQMEMFEDGGLKDEGGEVDEESGNEVPPGSTKEEVRDDIPARLSEGEFVFPADVVRYLGLDFLMRLRQKAKAGLQRMEEMGQMGNSDEATLPDDIPFTIEDLEMEDDPVEMQVGGVVTNPLGNPTNMPNQVTTMNQPNIYNPSMGQMYTPGGVTPYAPATFKSLLPQSSTGQVKTENRKYVKGSQVRFVPFIVGTGQPLNPAQLAQLEADGFKLDTGTISPTEKTKVETTKVQPTDTSSGDDSGTTSTLGATLAIGGDKDPNKPGLQTGSTTFEIGYNVPGRLPGISSIAALPGILGGKAPEGTTVDLKKGNITKTVSYEDFLKIKNDVTGQFAKDFVSRVNDLDKLNKNQIVFDPKVGYKDTVKDEVLTYEQITDPRDGLGKDIADRLEKETRDRSFLGFDVSTSATDAYNKLSDSEKSAYNDYVTESEEQEETRDTGFTSTAPSLSDIGRDDDPGPDDDAPDPSDSMDAAAAGGADSFGLFNQGGLLKRKPKVKKMKRGGLASR